MLNVHLITVATSVYVFLGCYRLLANPWEMEVAGRWVVPSEEPAAPEPTVPEPVCSERLSSVQPS